MYIDFIFACSLFVVCVAFDLNCLPCPVLRYCCPSMFAFPFRFQDAVKEKFREVVPVGVAPCPKDFPKHRMCRFTIWSLDIGCGGLRTARKLGTSPCQVALRLPIPT